MVFRGQSHRLGSQIALTSMIALSGLTITHPLAGDLTPARAAGHGPRGGAV
jgi:hypothetical protein